MKNYQIIDIEELYRKGVTPEISIHFKYRIKINTQKHVIDSPTISGLKVAELSGVKDPKNTMVFLVSKKGKEQIALNAEVDLTKCGVERFVVQENTCTDGLIEGREQQLPSFDLEFLDLKEYEHHLIQEGNNTWLVIHSIEIPIGYNVTTADLALLIPTRYPAVQIDMFNFSPPLKRVDGKGIPAATLRSINGKSFQQWSRHRSPANPWIAGEDNLESHLALITSCLVKELKR